jgi:RNA polymerase sigma-70 factor (ECF subfamily)
VDASAAVAGDVTVTRVPMTDTADDLEAVFTAQYARLARVIARILKDPARAEELAVDVLLKWTRYPDAHGEHAPGWLYRTALTTALEETRAQARRIRYATLFARVPFLGYRSVPTPEDLHADREDQRRVRLVLQQLVRRDASLLVLKSEGFSYAEMATILGINPASIGTLLARAQRAFKQEYVKRYGDA